MKSFIFGSLGVMAMLVTASVAFEFGRQNGAPSITMAGSESTVYVIKGDRMTWYWFDKRTNQWWHSPGVVLQ